MKKIFCLILTLLFMSSTCMASEVSITYITDTEELTVSGTASKGSKLVTVMVTAGDTDWSEIDSDALSPFEKLSKLSYFSQVRTDSDGAYSFSFKLTDIPDNVKGVYSARAYDETTGLIYYSDEIVCYSANAADTALGAVNSAGSVVLIEKAVSNYGEILGVDALSLSTLPKDKHDFVFGYLFANKPYESCDALCSAVGAADELSQIKFAPTGSDAANLLLAKGSELGLDETCAFDIYCHEALLTPQLRQAAAEDMQKAPDADFSSKETLKELFAKCVILNGCYSNKWSSVDTILKTAKPLSSYDMSLFKLAKDTSAVCKYINNIKYSSLAELTKAVEDYLKTPQQSGSQNMSSSSGGGSYSASLPSVTVPEAEAPKPGGFADMAGFEWANEAVEYLRVKNIIAGKSENTFEPATSVKREEFAKMIAIALDLQSAFNADFADVVTGAWYERYVSLVYGMGLMVGDDEGSFGVGEELTRQDIALILYRAAGSPEALANAPEFSDDSYIADYAKTAVKALSSMGVINGMGDGSFAPALPVTRAQAAKLVYELLMRT